MDASAHPGMFATAFPTAEDGAIPPQRWSCRPGHDLGVIWGQSARGVVGEGEVWRSCGGSRPRQVPDFAFLWRWGAWFAIGGPCRLELLTRISAL